MRLLMAPLLGMAVLIAGCDRQSAAPAQPQKAEKPLTPEAPPLPESTGTLDISHRGETMPVIVFEAPDGGPVTLGDFRGKPLLVNLWATWCGPCVAEMPALDALAKNEAERLQVLVINQDGSDNDRAKVDGWWAQRRFAMLKPYIDQGLALGSSFKTDMVPTTILYDKNGKEVWRVIGAMDWVGARANTLLAETISE